MARKCSICSHKDRNKIDSAITARIDSIDKISKQYSVTTSALNRHIASGHIQEKVKKAVEAGEIKEGADIMKMIMSAYDTTQEILTECRTIKMKEVKGVMIEIPPDNDMALKALARVEKQIEIIGKLLGAFTEKHEHTGNIALHFDVTDKDL